MDITEVTQITDELISAFARLIPQLSPNRQPPTQGELQKIVDSSVSLLFVARDAQQNGEIVGTLTLVLFRTPTGCKAWIEDVVIDEAARGQGAGEALNRAALERAKEEGAENVNLTSNPTREAANLLYQKIGFVLRKTNIYRYPLKTEEQ